MKVHFARNAMLILLVLMVWKWFVRGGKQSGWLIGRKSIGHAASAVLYCTIVLSFCRDRLGSSLKF